ncbi:hypothetical protein BSL78_22297 [Apostichopus japonicus]|uniref:Uncharacterized protein n=1 Tax=Stichopus japonicus TaxID=307972 RepID=A0A2G8JYN0_STIJA|nr:hypothetical protein BSL78_22297 [Apostichopus japonicus]
MNKISIAFNTQTVRSPSDSVTYVHHCTPIYCRANIFKKENGSLWIGIVSFRTKIFRGRTETSRGVCAKNQSATVDDVGSNSVADTNTGYASHCEEWCLCALCSPLESDKGRVCCYGLFAEKALFNAGECLTNRPEFSQIFLQPVHLELCFVNFLRYKKKNPFPTAAETITNRKISPTACTLQKPRVYFSFKPYPSINLSPEAPVFIPHQEKLPFVEEYPNSPSEIVSVLGIRDEELPLSQSEEEDSLSSSLEQSKQIVADERVESEPLEGMLVMYLM